MYVNEIFTVMAKKLPNNEPQNLGANSAQEEQQNLLNPHSQPGDSVIKPPI